MLFTERGIFDRGSEDEGVGKTLTPVCDCGVDAALAANANLSFNFSVGVLVCASMGVAGCSAELVTDLDEHKLGTVL